MAALAFSPYTEGILTYTADLARQLDANLLVCSVINHRDVNAIKRIVQLGYEVDSDHYVRGVEAERRQILDPLIEKLGLERQRIKTVFKIGNPVHEIIQTALDHSVEMIVMGTRANTELEHMIVGSVADRLFRRSPITIVSYRDPSVAERLHKRAYLRSTMKKSTKKKEMDG
jgi:nucleotide-binding universal stress UspA family protein